MAEEEDKDEDRRLARRSRERGTSPFREIDSIFEDLDRTLDRFFGRSPIMERTRTGMTGRRAPAIDMRELNDRYEIEAEIPGINKEDIEIELRDDSLVIEGKTSQETEEEGEDFLRKERGYRSFYRELPLPEDVKEEEISAELNQGILTVDLPREESKEKKGRTIDIK